MDLNNLTLFNQVNANMQYLKARQEILATNVANANTPGYVAKDIEKPNFANELKNKIQMTVTNEMHIKGLPSQQGENNVYTPKPTSALTLDGNGVVIEDQMNEISKTKSEYNRMISIYTKHRSLLSVANTKING